MAYLERLQSNADVKGYHLNRIVDALTNTRPSDTVNLIESYAICFGYQPVDSVFKARCRFWVTPNVASVIKVYLSFTLQPFHVGNQTTAAAVTSGPNGDHQHLMLQDTGTIDHSTILGQAVYNAKNASGFTVPTEIPIVGVHAVTDLWTFGTSGPHTHSIPSVALNPPTAIYEAGMAQGVHVFINGTDQTVALGGPWGTGTALDISALDITSFIQAVGTWHEIQLSSTSLGGLTVQIQYQSVLNSSL